MGDTGREEVKTAARINRNLTAGWRGLEWCFGWRRGGERSYFFLVVLRVAPPPSPGPYPFFQASLVPAGAIAIASAPALVSYIVSWAWG